MNKNNISIQLYTTRHFKPYEPILNFFSKTGIRNIELFGLESIDIDHFQQMMDSSNISSKSTHVSFEALENFKPKERKYYDLETFWSNGQKVFFQSI